MRKIVTAVLSAVLLIVLSACSADIPHQISSPEAPTPTETSSALETSYNPVTPQKNPFVTVEMPVPFEDEGGDGNEAFYDVHNIKLYGSAMSEDLAESIGMSSEDFYISRVERYGDFKSKLNKSSLLEMSNLLSVMIDYDIPDEIVLASLNKHNDMNERFAIQFNDEEFRERKFTDVEIEAILSRDVEKVLEVFATEYTIVIGDKAYSPAWVYYHSPEDYREAGITPEMLEAKREMYNKLPLTEEALAAFNDKIDEAVHTPTE